jgi:hypothetical protein
MIKILITECKGYLGSNTFKIDELELQDPFTILLMNF